MIVGHLPAGYIASALLRSRFMLYGASSKALLLAGMAGAVVPDLDMIYFHLVDHRQHHHHTYFTHFPMFWGACLMASFAWLRLSKHKGRAATALLFSLNGFIHLLLDSIVGDIWWLAPYVDRPFALFHVPALYQPWGLNFVFHWSFGLEILLVAWAIRLKVAVSYSRS